MHSFTYSQHNLLKFSFKREFFFMCVCICVGFFSFFKSFTKKVVHVTILVRKTTLELRTLIMVQPNRCQENDDAADSYGSQQSMLFQLYSDLQSVLRTLLSLLLFILVPVNLDSNWYGLIVVQKNDEHLDAMMMIVVVVVGSDYSVMVVDHHWIMLQT